MCEHWWDERLLREQAEKLKRQPVKLQAQPQPREKPQQQEKPERKPQNQPDPVPV
ncbi:MAG: hypothetical protein ACREUH_10365 [Burkholderiales bacterium]